MSLIFQNKCCQYWPDKENPEQKHEFFNDRSLTIKYIEQNDTDDYALREFSITEVNKEVRLDMLSALHINIVANISIMKQMLQNF